MGEYTAKVKSELNFKVGELNLNGRVYDPEMFEKALKEKIESDGGLPIVSCSDIFGGYTLDDVIGFVTSYEIKDGSVTMEGVTLNHYAPFMKTVTTAGKGKIENENEVTDFRLDFIYPLPQEAAPLDELFNSIMEKRDED